MLFTNSPEESAHKCLELLGLEGVFECVCGTGFQKNEYCKPEVEAFEKVRGEERQERQDGLTGEGGEQHHRS